MNSAKIQKAPALLQGRGGKVYESVDYAKIGNPGERAGLNLIFNIQKAFCGLSVFIDVDKPQVI